MAVGGQGSAGCPYHSAKQKVGVMYILLNGIQILIFDNQYLPLLMLDWEFSSEKSLPFSAGTDASSLCAPLQHPLDSEELPPELTLDGSGWCAKEGRACPSAATRKRSIDQPYSILGFIERRISDRRGRVNSQELNKPRTHCY